jgi:ATP-dependent Clp protease ATP-binding subunit ClpX
VEISLEKGTGARSLRSVLGKAMMDVMYSIPSMSNVRRVVITLATVEHGSQPLIEGDGDAVLKTA